MRQEEAPGGPPLCLHGGEPLGGIARTYFLHLLKMPPEGGIHSQVKTQEASARGSERLSSDDEEIYEEEGAPGRMVSRLYSKQVIPRWGLPALSETPGSSPDGELGDGCSPRSAA